MKRRTLYASIGLCGLLILSAAIPPTAASSPWPDDLFGPPGSDVSAQVQLPPQAKGRRNRQATVKRDLLQADEITLNLFDDVMLVAIRDRLVDDVKGSTVWIGHIEEEGDSEVILAVRGKAMMGTVRIGEQMYEIVYKGGETHVIQQIDPNVTVEDADPLYAPDPGPQAAPVDDQSSAPAPEAAADTAGTVVDLMVVYTPKARANASGVDGIEAKIVNAVEAANQAYLRSGVAMQLNLVHMAEVSYTESGTNMSASLHDLQGTSDGKMDEVHAWRTQYGADQVALISADSNYCGIGYQLSPTWLTSNFAPYAFAVVHDDSKNACLSNFTLAHELGHNQGSHHNVEDAGSDGAYPYSYGYRLCTTGGFRTVMSYSCTGGTRVGYFSNPDVYYGTEPTGIDGVADNARSMDAARTLVASWVSSTTPTAPMAPASLAAQAQSESGIRLTWSDSSDNETGFRVQRSPDAASWTEVAVVGSNVTAYADGGLAPDTRYSYRVYAYNGSGTSPFSNTALAQTLTTADTTPPTVRIANPEAGARVSGLVPISVTGSDNVALKSLELRIDGKLVGISSTATLSYNWNTRKLSGTHTIAARALDQADNASATTIQVSIDTTTTTVVRVKKDRTR